MCRKVNLRYTPSVYIHTHNVDVYIMNGLFSGLDLSACLAANVTQHALPLVGYYNTNTRYCTTE